MHEYHYIRYNFVRRSDCRYIIYHGPVLLLSQKNRLHSRVFGQNRPRHLCYHCVEPVGARIYELSGAEFCKSLPSGAHWALCDQKPFFSTFFNVFFVGFNQKYIVPRPQNISWFLMYSTVQYSKINFQFNSKMDSLTPKTPKTTYHMSKSDQ